MKRIHVLVEGQTEEAFVRELLEPHYSASETYLNAIVVSTGPASKGGIVSYGKVRWQIEQKCKEDPTAHVTTMFDLYALPEDFPGMRSEAFARERNGRRKAQVLEQALADDIGQRNFLPHLLVHEFEAVLFSDLDAFEEWTDDDAILKPLRAARHAAMPEDINDGPGTAPSKRIKAAFPTFEKTVHGPLIACEIGIDAIRAACPHFDEWLRRLEALP
ncbi:DUF4276 family protein [Roseateles sp.]|uniref:DUF4276 family protein n=1 Tax=Roseateles sp. TaxID=1971397 RepID=UPI0031DD8CBB